MALLIDANSEDVSIADAASIKDVFAGTALIWWEPATTAVASRVFCKGSNLRDVSRNTSVVLMVNSRAITDNSFQATWSNFAAYALDTQMFLAVTWDVNDTANCRFLVGNRTTVAAEPSAYDSKVLGDGTVSTDDTHPLQIGNRTDGLRPMNGEVSHFSFYTRVMSVAEIQAQQFRRRPASGCVVFMELGYNGTGTQPDWSGAGNPGTVTGATVSDHVPLPWRRQLQMHVPYTVAAGQQRRFLLTRF